MTGVEGFEVNNIYIYTWEGRVSDFFFPHRFPVKDLQRLKVFLKKTYRDKGKDVFHGSF